MQRIPFESIYYRIKKCALVFLDGSSTLTKQRTNQQTRHPAMDSIVFIRNDMSFRVCYALQVMPRGRLHCIFKYLISP